MNLRCIVVTDDGSIEKRKRKAHRAEDLSEEAHAFLLMSFILASNFSSIG
jgi:hypothetical protein